MHRIVVDTMSGDLGPTPIIEAIIKFKKEHKDVEVIACGDEKQLKPLEGIAQIIPTTQIVPMTAGALEVMRLKDSSMVRAIKEVKEGRADAVISAGSTGGFLSASTLILKNIEGVKRGALVTGLPIREEGKYATLLDCGASNVNTSEELYQFALMGRLYSQAVCGYDNPNTYLLSNGSEDDKGTDEIKEANKLLRERDFPNFKGNVEAREAVLDEDVHVIVAPGFSGNIFLKALEGTAKMMSGLIKKAFLTNLSTKIGYLFSKKGVDGIKQKMNYKAVGGALLLGINGVVVKAHGNSDAFAFNSALNVAYKMLDKDVVNAIKEGLK